MGLSLCINPYIWRNVNTYLLKENTLQVRGVKWQSRFVYFPHHLKSRKALQISLEELSFFFSLRDLYWLLPPCLTLFFPVAIMKILILSILDLFLRHSASVYFLHNHCESPGKNENNTGFWWYLDGMCYIHIRSLKIMTWGRTTFSTPDRHPQPEVGD